MSRTCSSAVGLALGAVLFIASAARAEPVIQLTEDWGQATTSVWFTPDTQGVAKSKQGLAWQGMCQVSNDLVLDQWGEPDEMTATGRIMTLGEKGNPGLYATVEPAGLRERGRGRAHTELSWRLQIGQEVVTFVVNMWANGGSSHLYLYDETDGQVLADTTLYEGFGTSLSGQLQPGHVYRLQGDTLAEALLGPAVSAGLEFSTDAIVLAVP